MDDFTKEVAGAYGLWKLREIEARLAEANRAASERDTQHHNEEEERRHEQQYRDTDQRTEQNERAQEANRILQEHSTKYELAQQQQAQQHATTIHKLTEEMSELKVLMSLPEAERAGYLQRQDDARILKQIHDNELQMRINLEIQLEEQCRMQVKQDKIDKLRKILHRFVSEGILSDKVEAMLDVNAYLFDATITKPNVIGEHWGVPIANRRIPLSDIDIDMSYDDVDKLILEDKLYIERRISREARQQIKEQQLVVDKKAEESRTTVIWNSTAVAFCIASFALFQHGHWFFSIVISIVPLFIFIATLLDSAGGD